MRRFPFLSLTLLLLVAVSLGWQARRAHAQLPLPVETWTALTPGPGASDTGLRIGVDDCGNVYTGGLSSGFRVVSYNAQGAQRWARDWKSPTGQDQFAGMAVSPEGAVYVTGWSFIVGADAEIITLKYDSAGTLLWEQHFTRPTPRFERSRDLVIDRAGNAYVLGELNSGNHADLLLLKYSPEGELLWGREFDGDLARDDRAVGLALDGNQGLYVACTSFSNTDFAVITLRYTLDGSQEWAKFYHGVSTDTRATAIANDPTGGVVVTGTTAPIIGLQTVAATVRYDRNGNETWDHVFDGGMDGSVQPADVAVDRQGRAAVICRTFPGGSAPHPTLLVHYTPSGSPEWQAELDTVAPVTLFPQVEVDGDNTIYTLTNPTDANSGLDYRVDAYTPAGEGLWRRQSDAAQREDAPQALAVDGAGSVYVTGYGKNGSGRQTLFTVKYDNSVGTPGAVEVFDANPLYTLGQRLPVTAPEAAAAALGSAEFANKGRRPAAVAADGVSLLLLRVELAPTSQGSVHFTLLGSSADPGSLWAIDAPGLRDTSTAGGQRDQAAEPREVTVPGYTVGGKRYAFALYRSPRNFDPAGNGGPVFRDVALNACIPGRLGSGYDRTLRATLRIVRPLVLFVHGTFSSPATWQQFPTYQFGSNEQSGWSAFGNRPFYCARLSFHSVAEAAGRADESARVLLPQFADTIYRWSQRLNYAATQADVVTHSYGGVVTRVAATLQQESVLGEDATTNFRAALNWGHGPVHKLITIAATHRGAAIVNHIARMNFLTGGNVAGWARLFHQAIDQGALEDQFVTSAAERLLNRPTPFPGHAIVGLGRYGHGGAAEWFFFLLRHLDARGGIYTRAFEGVPEETGYQRLANYVFNLNYDSDLDPDTGVHPANDLVVSTRSARGGMTGSAFSAINDGSAGIIHTSQTSSPLVADRVEFLLRQSTTSAFFQPFPAFVPEFSLAEVKLRELSFPLALYQNATLLGTTGTGPELTTDAVNGTVHPGQTLHAAVTWPGKTIDSALFLWTAEGGIGAARTSGADPATEIRVAAGLPAAYPLLAIVTATDGTRRDVQIQLQIEDNDVITALAVEPESLTLSGGYPAGLRVYGQLQDGSWRDLTVAARTHLESNNPAVAAVQANATVRAVAVGNTSIQVQVEDGGSVMVPVTVTAAPPAPPAVPSGLAASTPDPSAVRLDWNDNSTNEEGFEIERREPDGRFAVVGLVGAGVKQFQDAGREPLGRYTYRVRAVNSGGHSAYTAEASATVPAPSGGKLTVGKLVNFGKVKLGQLREKALKIKNGDRSAPLTVRIQAPQGAGYSISETGTRTVPPRGTLTLTLRFAPGQAGTSAGTLPLASSDPGHSAVTVKLKGSAK